MEDLLRLSYLLWEANAPFDFEGNHWSFKRGYIGSAKPGRRPQIWALGAGPRLLDLAARYCDGLEAAAPQTHARPEQFAERVTSLKAAVERYDRDPEQFGFGVWLMSAIHEDPDVLAEVLESPLVRYLSGMGGRFDPKDWRDEGLEPVMPEDWHYAMKWLPFSQTPDEADSIVGRTSVEMARKSWYVGTPDEISQVATEFVEAGATFVGVVDVVPLVKGLAEAEGSFRRSARVAAAAKAHGARTVHS